MKPTKSQTEVGASSMKTRILRFFLSAPTAARIVSQISMHARSEVELVDATLGVDKAKAAAIMEFQRNRRFTQVL